MRRSRVGSPSYCSTAYVTMAKKYGALYRWYAHLCLGGRAGRLSHWRRKMMEDSITCPSCEPVKHVLARFGSTLSIGE